MDSLKSYPTLARNLYAIGSKPSLVLDVDMVSYLISNSLVERLDLLSEKDDTFFVSKLATRTVKPFRVPC